MEAQRLSLSGRRVVFTLLKTTPQWMLHAVWAKSHAQYVIKLVKDSEELKNTITIPFTIPLSFTNNNRIAWQYLL